MTHLSHTLMAETVNLSFSRRAAEMPGRFEEMSSADRELFKKIFPEKTRKGRGMPAAHPRKVLNSLLFIAVTVRVPLARSSARRSMGIKKCWLKAWHSDGRLKELQAQLLGDAQNEGLICWKSGVAGVAHGYKEKSVLIHFVAAGKLIETVAVKTAKAAQEREKVGGR